MRRGCFLAISILCLASGSTLYAQDAAVGDAGAGRAPSATAQDEVAALMARAHKLRDARDEAIRAPAQQAELALARARSAADAAGRARSLSIAEAALALAEARVALLRERELTSSAARRRVEAERRAEQARVQLREAQQVTSAPDGGQP